MTYLSDFLLNYAGYNANTLCKKVRKSQQISIKASVEIKLQNESCF